MQTKNITALAVRKSTPANGKLRPMSSYRQRLIRQHKEGLANPVLRKYYVRPRYKPPSRRSMWEIIEENERCKKFFNPRTARLSLLALIDIHSQGVFFKHKFTFSEDYSHPWIGSIAIPGKKKVVFKKNALSTIDQNDKAKQVFENHANFASAWVGSMLEANLPKGHPSNQGPVNKFVRRKGKLVPKFVPEKVLPTQNIEARAKDVAFLALSINLPYWTLEQREQGKVPYLHHTDEPPKSVIDVGKFAQVYAKRARIPAKRIKEFVRGVELEYGSMHSSHYDHAGDHV